MHVHCINYVGEEISNRDLRGRGNVAIHKNHYFNDLHSMEAISDLYVMAKVVDVSMLVNVVIDEDSSETLIKVLIYFSKEDLKVLVISD